MTQLIKDGVRVARDRHVKRRPCACALCQSAYDNQRPSEVGAPLSAHDTSEVGGWVRDDFRRDALHPAPALRAYTRGR
jgi:hypothetical protein